MVVDRIRLFSTYICRKRNRCKFFFPLYILLKMCLVMYLVVHLTEVRNEDLLRTSLARKDGIDFYTTKMEESSAMKIQRKKKEERVKFRKIEEIFSLDSEDTFESDSKKLGTGKIGVDLSIPSANQNLEGSLVGTDDKQENREKNNHNSAKDSAKKEEKQEDAKENSNDFSKSIDTAFKFENSAHLKTEKLSNSNTELHKLHPEDSVDQKPSKDDGTKRISRGSNSDILEKILPKITLDNSKRKNKVNLVKDGKTDKPNLSSIVASNSIELPKPVYVESIQNNIVKNPATQQPEISYQDKDDQKSEPNPIARDEHPDEHPNEHPDQLDNNIVQNTVIKNKSPTEKVIVEAPNKIQSNSVDTKSQRTDNSKPGSVKSDSNQPIGSGNLNIIKDVNHNIEQKAKSRNLVKVSVNKVNKALENQDKSSEQKELPVVQPNLVFQQEDEKGPLLQKVKTKMPNSSLNINEYSKVIKNDLSVSGTLQDDSVNKINKEI